MRVTDSSELDVEGDPRRWWTLPVLCLSLFMVVMGNTVLNIALPKISESLAASGTELQWMIDAYALVFAGLLFTAGSLGDRFGRKGALTIGLVIFGAGSAAATFSTTAATVVACRAVMGVGAAFVMPATLSILTHVFPPHERAKAIGVWAGVAGAAGAVGPLASGYLLEHFYWGSVFWLNVPVVVVALVAGYFLVPTSRHPDRVPLDPLGALLSIGAIGSLVYGVIEAPQYGWTDPLILAAFAVAVVLGVAFVVWERQVADPMLPIHFFRERGFTGGSLAISMVFFGMFGMFFLLTQYLQMVRGYSALGAAVRTLPFSATIMIAAPSSAALAARFGTRAVVSTGLVTAGTGLVLMSRADLDSPYWLLALSFAVLAAGMGLTMAPSTAAIMTALPHAKAGVGSAMNDTTRELGGALGVAVLGSLLASTYGDSVRSATAELPPALAEQVGHSLGDALRVAGQLGPAAGEVLGVAREAFVDGMSRALLAGAGVAFVGAVIAGFLLPTRTVLDEAASHEAPVAGS
jgi:EmrB/QacA subfamily drug resistance transporter